MKTTDVQIKNILILALVAVLGLQFLWLYNLNRSYTENRGNQISQIFIKSIDRDLQQRIEQLGGNASLILTPISKTEDSLAIREMIIETEDTSIVLSYDARFRFDEKKSEQTVLKHVLPLDILTLDTIFRSLLLEEKIPVLNSFIEFHDKDTNTSFYSGNQKKAFMTILFETEMIYIDLTQSIGVKAYVETPVYAFFQKMLLQLLLSAILIVATLICLFKISFAFFRQRKEQRIKQNFINAMTHELKRPISSSLSLLDYLDDQIKENDFSSAEEYISDSIFSLKRLNSYVEKIQEISKGEDNKIEFIRKTIELNDFFTRLKEKYKSDTTKEINFYIDIPNNITIQTDKLHFTNIMENLMENSIKYSGESLDVKISVKKAGSYITISHWDNGWGISDSEINRIFDAFFRGRSTEKRRKNGFGLGLSYVKQIINNMGGEIVVFSKEKEFTEFVLKLPI